MTEAGDAFETLREQGGIVPDDLLVALEHLEEMERERLQAAGEVDRCADQADTARTDLAKQMTERKTYDHLRERQKARHEDELRTKAQKATDDRIAGRWERRR